MRHFSSLPFLLLVFVLSGCSGGNDDLRVVSKEIHREALSMSVSGDQFGSAAGSAIENTVVGQLQNSGSEEARNVEITFRLTGGGQNFTVVARVPSVPPGKTVAFRTDGVRTAYTLQFKNEGEVEIKVGKQE